MTVQVDSTDAAALRWFAHRSDPAALLHKRFHNRDWLSLKPALVELFDLDRKHHFFRAAPSFLRRLHEPQVTTAIRNVLDHDPKRRLRYCQALMAACGADVRDPLVRVVSIEADEARRRLDLAVHGITQGGDRRCLLIEAKFAAPLQPDQLERYRKLVSNDYPDPTQRILRIVGFRSPANFDRERNAEWRFLHWSALLLRWQRELDDTDERLMHELMVQIWKQR